ncbi:hypothetical protein FKP32DRAFT_1600309 [Trametes sanguinea]|nr:hypothetical protein FKP32DRAFT_1600309 [Trametes sanguinea]
MHSIWCLNIPEPNPSLSSSRICTRAPENMLRHGFDPGESATARGNDAVCTYGKAFVTIGLSGNPHHSSIPYTDVGTGSGEPCFKPWAWLFAVLVPPPYGNLEHGTTYQGCYHAPLGCQSSSMHRFVSKLIANIVCDMYGTRHAHSGSLGRVTAVSVKRRDLPSSETYIEQATRQADLFLPLARWRTPLGFHAYVYHIPHARRLRRDLSFARSEHDRVRCLSRHKDRTASVYENVKRYQRWQEESRILEHTHAMSVMSYRRSELQAAGYSEELQNLGSRHQGLTGRAKTLVEKAEPLTDTAWEHMSSVLEDFLLERRACHLRFQHRNLIVKRLWSLQFSMERVRVHLGSPDTFPHPIDMLAFDEIRAIICGPMSAPDVACSEVAECVAQCIPRWESAREQQVADLMNMTPGQVFRQVDQPSLLRKNGPSDSGCGLILGAHAKLSLLCLQCKVVLYPSMAMSHACCYAAEGEELGPLTLLDDAWASGTIPIIKGDLLDNACAVAFGGLYQQWSSRYLRPCGHYFRGLSESVLESPTPRSNALPLACGLCSKDGSWFGMTWQAAVRHIFDEHNGDPVPWVELSRTTGDGGGLNVPSNQDGGRDAGTASGWFCARCPWPSSLTAYRMETVEAHIRTKHSLQLSTAAVDSNKSPSRLPFAGPPGSFTHADACAMDTSTGSQLPSRALDRDRNHGLFVCNPPRPPRKVYSLRRKRHLQLTALVRLRTQR